MLRWSACGPVFAFATFIVPWVVTRATDDPVVAQDITATQSADDLSSLVESNNSQPSLTAASVESALLQLVDRAAPSVVLIEANRRPANLAPAARTIDNAWVSFGAGVVIHRDGRILTCQHLIAGATEIVIVDRDGLRRPARRVAEDRRSDLAVLRCDALHRPPMDLGETEPLRRGSLVLSFGDPLGLGRDGEPAVAYGIVGALNRSLPPSFGYDEDRFYGDMIQTTILAGPGSSGGPLVGSDGRIVGVIAAVPMRGGDLAPISFAIPMNERNRGIVRRLADGQVIEHGYLGVEVDVLTDAQRKAAQLDAGRGVRIAAVFADAPADRAGLVTGDIVVSIGGRPVTSVDEFVSLIGAHTVGERAAFDVVRDGRPTVVTATLTRRPGMPEVDALPEVTLNFRGAVLARVNGSMREMANLPANALLVVRVDAGTPAERAGLMPGEIVIRADGRDLPRDAAVQLLDHRGDVMLGLASGATIVIKP